MNELLTIIIPLYNQEKYIQQCIESIMQQSLRNISLIIVNDGSTDNSLEICRKLAAVDNRITIISQENKGLIQARISGLNYVKSKYVTFVDADDFILSNSYEFAFVHMEDNIDLILFEISRYYNENKIKREYHIIEEGIYNKERIIEEIYPKLIWDFERKTPGIDVSLCVKIVKTDLLKKQYKELEEFSFYYGEDAAISYPLMTKINSMVAIKKSYYMHRQRVANNIAGYIKSNNFFDEVYNLYKYLQNIMYVSNNYNFNKQIDYFYMYSVELKKLNYMDYFYSRDFLFPFDVVDYGQNIILYGAGDVGKTYYDQILKLNYCRKIYWIDKNAKYILDKRVKDLEWLEKNRIENFNCIIIAIENKDICKNVKKELVEMGFSENSIFY